MDPKAAAAMMANMSPEQRASMNQMMANMDPNVMVSSIASRSNCMEQQEPSAKEKLTNPFCRQMWVL